MLYTTLCVKFLMRADTLCGEGGGGLALEILKLHEPISEWNLGPKKLKIFSANPGKILAPAENQADG
jgi:hypothetical protein